MALCPGGIWAAIVRRWCDLSRMGDRVCAKGNVWACGLWPACGRFDALLALGEEGISVRGDTDASSVVRSGSEKVLERAKFVRCGNATPIP